MTAAGSYLAVDIGATKLAVRTARDGAPHDEVVSWPIPGSADADLDVLRTAVAAARGRLGGVIDGAAAACAATLDADGTVVAWPNRPSWLRLGLLDALSSAAGVRVAAADDGSLAALAEADAVACPDLLYVGIGTGVGGGVVSGGRLLLGAAGRAGEIGHLPTDPDGPACRCGRRGCLQAVVCAAALAEQAGRLRGAATTPEEMAAAAAASDKWALRTLWDAAGHLAVAMLAAVEMLDPARVHLGGGLGSALGALPGMLTERLGELRRPGHPMPSIHAARLGADAPLVGAMLLARSGTITALAPLGHVR